MKKAGVSKSEDMDGKMVNRHKRMAMGEKIELKKGGKVDSKRSAKETKPKKKK